MFPSLPPLSSVLCSDVCNSTDLPEFEIISLLEEQLPVYRLRADTVYGYDHDDWLHTPLVAPDASFDLTTEQIEETLKYFRKSKKSQQHADDFLQNISVSCAADALCEQESSCFKFRQWKCVKNSMWRTLEINPVGFHICDSVCEQVALRVTDLHTWIRAAFNPSDGSQKDNLL